MAAVFCFCEHFALSGVRHTECTAYLSFKGEESRTEYLEQTNKFCGTLASVDVFATYKADKSIPRIKCRGRSNLSRHSLLNAMRITIINVFSAFLNFQQEWRLWKGFVLVTSQRQCTLKPSEYGFPPSFKIAINSQICLWSPIVGRDQTKLTKNRSASFSFVVRRNWKPDSINELISAQAWSDLKSFDKQIEARN